VLTENQIPFKKEIGSYGGGGKIFYDYTRNAIVITSYLQRKYYPGSTPNTTNIIVNNTFTPIYEIDWAYTHYIIAPTPENIEKLNKILKVNITLTL